jgi:hypothetical protein
MKTDTHYEGQEEKQIPTWLVTALVALLLALIAFSVWVALTSDSATGWPSLPY